MSFRIGNGYDVHAFADGESLVLGGIEIPHERGLVGHSDADVLLHAIIDSVLGALAWGDIGSWFPDTDEQYRGVDSKELFAAVWAKVYEAGWTLGNCDCVVIAQEPKLRPHVDSIRQSVRELFSCELDQVSVKATTTEELGFVGRGEGMAAQAVVLLVRNS